MLLARSERTKKAWNKMGHISILLWCTLFSIVIVVALFLEDGLHLGHNADHLEENFIPTV
jgi:hypothetical protein